MDFRKAEKKDLARIWEITNMAKAQLKGLGLDQWQTGYPSLLNWQEDVAQGMAYVVLEDEKILGAFAYQLTPDVSYGIIENGSWLTDGPYASMHRVIVADGCKGKGLAGKMFAYGFSMAKRDGFSSVRIDTHPGNIPMQHALKKAGFVACGDIYLAVGPEKGERRIGFERLLKNAAKCEEA